MLTPDCAPPQSLVTWTAALLYEALALGIEALALLFTLRLVKGAPRGGLALRGVLCAGALAVAVWSLAIRAEAQATYQEYAALFQENIYACLGGLHGPPGAHAAFMRHMREVAAPIEHAAAIASGFAVALLIAGAYALALWLRWRWRVAPQSMAGMEGDEWRRERMVERPLGDARAVGHAQPLAHRNDRALEVR